MRGNDTKRRGNQVPPLVRTLVIALINRAICLADMLCRWVAYDLGRCLVLNYICICFEQYSLTWTLK